MLHLEEKELIPWESLGMNVFKNSFWHIDWLIELTTPTLNFKHQIGKQTVLIPFHSIHITSMYIKHIYVNNICNKSP